MKISRDTPLAEITLRRYEKPSQLSRRECVRKVCLSLGLLQPGDSRDVIVDILDIIVQASKKKAFLTSLEIEQSLKKSRKVGIAPSNIRRQLKRLKDVSLIDKLLGGYRLSEFLSLREVVDEKLLGIHLESIKERVRDYCSALDRS